MSKIKTRPFDVSNYLNDEADIAAYLQVAIEDGDPALLAAALGNIARARGLPQLARVTGLSRDSLSKSLSGDNAPRTSPLFTAFLSMAIRLAVEPCITLCEFCRY